MIKLNFASDEFFVHLKNEVQKEDSNGDIYLELDRVVRNCIMGFIVLKVPDGYEEDVYQEVFFTVWRNLSSYILKMEEKSENQRFAWLITITKRRIADFYERYYKRGKDDIYIDGLENWDIAADNEDSDECTALMKEVLSQLFSIATSPEKIMSYVYSKIILSMETTSGKPKETMDYLYGRNLFQIFEKMKVDLQMILGVSICDSVFKSLEEKLYGIDSDGKYIGEKTFELDIRKIVDGSSRIQKKLEGQKCRR